MNNQFSQRVSDIIVYSKEEANRLRSRYIGPEHLLLGILRDGEGKAIEILSKLNPNLTTIKQQIEAQLKVEADDMLLPDAEVSLSNDAAKILKMCILEARGMKSNIADTEHVLLAILRERNNMAASVLEANDVNYVKVLEQATLQPDVNSGMGFPEDLSPYAMVIHCGGCMLNEREVRFRMKCAQDQGVPITNYGIAIAHMRGILKRSPQMLPQVRKILEKQ